MSDEDLERFLMMSGLVWLSVLALRPAFPRWRRRLGGLGIYSIPQNMHSQDPADSHAVNNLTLLVRQAAKPEARDARVEHYLRNVTRVRPEKP